jgi:hypothetical protein
MAGRWRPGSCENHPRVAPSDSWASLGRVYEMGEVVGGLAGAGYAAGEPNYQRGDEEEDAVTPRHSRGAARLRPARVGSAHRGVIRSLARRRIRDGSERVACLIVIAPASACWARRSNTPSARHQARRRSVPRLSRRHPAGQRAMHTETSPCSFRSRADPAFWRAVSIRRILGRDSTELRCEGIRQYATPPIECSTP